MNSTGHGIETFVLAGGEGKRLFPLTRRRAKPAMPFAGEYRLIDFVLTNLVHSNLLRVHVLKCEVQKLIVLDDPVQPVRAEHEPVALRDRLDRHVRPFADLAGAEVFPQHVLELVLAGFLPADRAGLHERLGERVIDRQLRDLLAANEVRPAVTDAG